MNWIWTPGKAVSNLKTHKVSFELAVGVFDDPHQLSRPDIHPDGDRWQTIGRPLAGSLLALLVVHTDVDENGGGRIISARKATPRERKAYEDGTF